MASIISTKTSGGGGIAVTGDTSGVLELQSNNGTTAVTISTGQVVSFVNNFGTVAGYPSYQCRAWVNFNGTGTVAIRASGNVTSITDHGTGSYTVNFTNSMPDTNYCIQAFCSDDSISNRAINLQGTPSSIQTTTSSRIGIFIPTSGNTDAQGVYVAIFR